MASGSAGLKARRDVPSVAARYRLRRRTVGWFFAAVVALVAAMPSVLYAHGKLQRTTPADSATLTAAPTELRLEFSEDVELALTTLELMGPNGAVALGDLKAAPGGTRIVMAPISGALAPGAYEVRWRTSGSDSHPVSGSFSFTIAANATGVVPPAAAPTAGEAAGAVAAPGQAPPPASHHLPSSAEGGGFNAESPGYVLVRWLQFTGLLIVIGAVAFNLAVLEFLRRKENPDSPMLAPARDRAARVGYWAALALAVVAVLRLLAQSYALHGAAQVLNLSRIGTMVGRTLWGRGWILQIFGVVLAVIGFRLAKRGSRTGWALAAVAAVALAFTPGLSGHAAAAPKLRLLAILADTAHVIGAGGWLGSLLLVLVVGIPAALQLSEEGQRGPCVAEVVNAFSPTALFFAGTAAATGTFSAWLNLGSVPALWETRYGVTLLVKLAVLSLVAGTGAYNWLKVKPALGDLEGAARMRRSATIELAVGLVVLLVTAVLVATPNVAGMTQ